MQRVWTTIAGIAITAFAGNALAQGTLRIGMTAADIPLTTGQTDNGGEGMRFMGYTVYDGLVNWDLSSADKASDIVPGLATSWSVDAADKLGGRSRSARASPSMTAAPSGRNPWCGISKSC